MSRLHRALLAFAVCLFAWVSPALAAASGPGLTETWMGLPRWFWLSVNLLVFWGGLLYLLGPPIRRFLNQRSERIAQELQTARQQRDEAQSMQATLEKRVAELEAEMKEMLERGEESARHERDEVVRQAEIEKDRILEQARGEIDNRVHLAKQDLQSHAAQLAVTLAGDKIKGALNESDHDRLFDEALARLDQQWQTQRGA